MQFQLFDATGGRLIGTYSNQAEALAVVRSAIASHGAESVQNLLLAAGSLDEEGAVIAEGRELVALASKRGNSRRAA